MRNVLDGTFSRIPLGSNLYRLYLAVLGWFILPIFGVVLAAIFPTEWKGAEGALDLGVPLLGLAGIWSGFRGGPILLPRSSIVHELLSPSSKRSVIFPWLLRQVAASMIAAGLIMSVLWSLAHPVSFEYGSAMAASCVAGLGAASSLFQAVLWSVAVHHEDIKLRRQVLASTLLVPAAHISALAVGVSFSTAVGFGVLLGTVAASGLLAIMVLNNISIEMLWKRSDAFDSIQSVFMTLDLQKVVLSLRKVSERPDLGKRSSLTSRQLPTPVWGLWVTIRNNLQWHLARLLILAGAVAGLCWGSDLRQGLVVLTIAGCMFLLGMETSGPVSATAAQKVFLIHYPSGSSSVLRGQVFTTAGLGLVVGFAVTGFGVFGSTSIMFGTVLLSISGTLGAMAQARLGSPDLGSMIDRYGFELLGPALLLRAFSGPTLVLASTASIFHQFFLNNNLTLPWSTVTIFVGLASFVISTKRLEV